MFERALFMLIHLRAYITFSDNVVFLILVHNVHFAIGHCHGLLVKSHDLWIHLRCVISRIDVANSKTCRNRRTSQVWSTGAHLRKFDVRCHVEDSQGLLHMLLTMPIF